MPVALQDDCVISRFLVLQAGKLGCIMANECAALYIIAATILNSEKIQLHFCISPMEGWS